MKIYPREQMKHYLIVDAISLVFLFFIVLETETVLGLPLRLTLLVIFLLAFYIGLWYRDWRLLLGVLVGIGILTVFGMFVKPTILIFGFIFADFLGKSTSHWYRGIGIAAIGAMFVIVFFSTFDNELEWEHSFLLPIMILQMGLPLLIYIKEKHMHLKDELLVANHQLEQQFIEEQERHRIARDLHDTLGQTLTMIKLKSELSIKWIDRDVDQSQRELEDILTSSKIALKQVREIVSEMKFISLNKEIEQLRTILTQAGIDATVEVEEATLLFSSVEETMLSLSLREAVTNVIRHSEATHCLIKLCSESNIFHAQVIDNGIGLQQLKNGMGMQTMKERMRTMNGSATVEDCMTDGTSVTLRLPISHHERGVLK